MKTRLLVPALVLFVLAGCGTSSTASPASSAPTGAASTSATSAAPSTAAALDAKAVLAMLTAANLGITNTAIQDEDTDPNNLIGRPAQYTSRASFDLPGGDTSADKYGIDRGGVIECFATEADAAARFKYVDTVTKSSPMLAEYHYLHGAVIVRLAKGVKPSLAAKFEAALKGLLG